MADCNRCGGTGRVRTKERSTWELMMGQPGMGTCPKCKGSGRYQGGSSGGDHRSQSPRETMWAEKTCSGLKNSYCNNTIRYRKDWDKIPELCPSCRDKLKQLKAARDAEYRTGKCENCGGETRYHMSKNPPKLCKSCFDRREANKRTKSCKRCSQTIIYYIGEKEFEYCKQCASLRVRVVRQNNSFQAIARDGSVLFTFGRCSFSRDDRRGGDAERRREWASRGYFWVAMNGRPHETFIVAQNPVVDGFIQAVDHRDTSYSTATLARAWGSMAIAVVSSFE